MNSLYNDMYDHSDHDSYYSDYDRFLDNESNYSNDNYDKGNTIIHSKSTTSKYNHSLDNIEINPFIRNLYVTTKDFKSSNNENDKDNKNKEDLSFYGENLNIVELNYFIEFEKKKYNENKHIYFTQKKIFTLLIESGAGIFGGFVRDYLIHKLGSNSFYDFMNNESSYLFENIPLFYCNEKFHPESYQNRNTISADIDTVMNMKCFESFLSTLDSFNIKYNYTISNNFKKYIHIINDQNQISKYIRFKIIIDNPFDINNFESFSNIKNIGNNISFKNYATSIIDIDILICKDEVSIKNTIENITSNSDFYCNSLYILNDTLSISKNISRNLKEFSFGIETLYQDNIRRNLDIFLKKNIYTKEVIEIVKKQIFEKKAICLNLSKKKEYRMSKIKSKGFTILVNHNIFEYVSCKDETCLLCRCDKLEGNKVIKFKCCNSFYHEECLVEYIKKVEIKKCLLCSKYIDGEMFKYIFNF
jgi:hypothetical protein